MVGEIIKLAISAGATLRDSSTTEARGKLERLVRTSLPMAVPALVFWLMNLLSYVSLKRIDASTFTVCSQARLAPFYIYIYILPSFFRLFYHFFLLVQAHSYARSKTKNARSEIDKSAVFDRAKSFSFRKRKASNVRPKIRLGLNCGASGMSGGWGSIIGNLNLRGLTQLRLELFRLQLSSCTIVLVGCLLKASVILILAAV